MIQGRRLFYTTFLLLIWSAAAAAQSNNPPPLLFKTEPVVYRLSVRYLDGGIRRLHFRDEEMADRIAKAMNHAIELCGGGSKDPFRPPSEKHECE